MRTIHLCAISIAIVLTLRSFQQFILVILCFLILAKSSNYNHQNNQNLLLHHLLCSFE